jgi:hypothetical protein
MICSHLAFLAFMSTSQAFTPATNTIAERTHLAPLSTTALFGKRSGRLGNNIALNEDGKISKIMTKKEKQQLGNSKMKRGKKDEAMEISPLLAEWAKGDSDTKSSGSTATVSSVDNASVFTAFDDEDSRSKKRRSKTKTASAPSLINSAKVDEILNSIQEILSTPNSNVPHLISIGNTSSLKSILAEKPGRDEKQPAYRLAWVGSDNAICHIGTSLHKVPLARLQEVYLCLGYNRWELLEVIRILGPFPNVRNTLRGDVKVEKGKGSGFARGSASAAPSTDDGGREAVRMTIAYNSMVDGTGKEILAGKEDNVKYVGLDVWFANEKAIVCTIVPTSDEVQENVGDPLMRGNGERVLLFVAEENLEQELEKLRAA